jgi:hypothetical protein
VFSRGLNAVGNSGSSSANLDPDFGAPDLSTASSTTTVDNQGSVAGTNAPYVIYRACKKD